MKPSEALALHRAAIRHVVETHRACNARVFGSVVHGLDTNESDLDILIDPTPDTMLFDKKVGKSGKRKKVIGQRSRESSEAQQAYYARLRETNKRRSTEGIDLEIHPSWKWERLNWAMCISLVAPIEVRNEQELAKLADLAKRLVLQKTTLAREFPDAVYDRASWLRDRETIKKNNHASPIGLSSHAVRC